MLAVIRIRGTVGLRKELKDAFRMLNLEKRNRCVVVPEKPEFTGMVMKVKDFVTWGTVSDDVLAELVRKRARTERNEKLEEGKVKEAVGKIKEFKTREAGLKPYFRLSPPSSGFKGSVKQHYPKGAVGNRGDKINELLKRMM